MPEPTVADQSPELMASSIVTTSVRVRIAEVGDVHPGDDVQLTPITGPIRVLDVQDGWAPALTALVVSVPRDPQQPSGPSQQDLRGTLVVPADLEVTMLSAIREARIVCLLCQRLCLWVFDYALPGAVTGRLGGRLRRPPGRGGQ
jgi:hypothetical protein